jgi:nitrosocyanin
MKKMLVILLILIVSLLSACQSRIVGDTITGGVVGPVEYGETKEERQGAETVTVKEFHIVADKSIYRPKILEVNEGDFVRLIIYASNANHGIVIPAYGINEFLEEDNYKTIEFVADKPGTFTFFSNVYSGPGTKDMTGTLIVKEVE